MKVNLLKEVLDLRASAWKAYGEDSDTGLSGRVLRKHPSFRLMASASRDPLIGFRMLKRLRDRWQIRSGFGTHRNPDSRTLVMDGVSRNRDAVLSYVECMLGERVGHFVSRDDLPGQIKLRHSRWPLVFWRYALATAFSCIWSRQRFHRALGIFSVAELTVILEYIESEGVNHVVDFAPYLLDSNLLYLLLRERGVRVTKVPSAGPLGTHNHILLSDDVVLSTPYHAFEMKRYAETFWVSQTQKWMPERTQNYIDRYRKNRPEAAVDTLGYYSHGSWVRAAEGHSSDGLGLHQKEENLLGMLGAVLRNHPEWKLMIFPHPREKKPEILDQTRAYYESKLGDLPFEISLDARPTAMQFESASVGVAVFSSIIYERLFSGYRTIIYHEPGDAFPDPETSLFQIAVRNSEVLEKKLSETMAQSDEAFFASNGIEGYHWMDYTLPDELPVTL